MSNDLFKAILAMDAYNRSYNQGIEGIDGDFLGSAEIISDSAIFGDVPNTNPGIRKDANIGFYAIAYEYQGEVIISS